MARLVLTIAALAIVLPATSACSPGSERTAARADSATARADSAVPRADSAAPTPARDASAPATSSAPLTVTERGIGPLVVGMSFADATAALGGALVVPPGADTTGCDYLVWRGGPAGVQVMFDAHHIARIDVDTASVATAAGARVGDGEARVRRLYAGRVTVTPHKYEDGHYLTVTPTDPASANDRIVFETAGGRVTRYRAGLMPSVGYVEGCS